MKRTALLTLTIMLVLTFSSCIVIPLHRTFDIDESTILSIEIYDLCKNESSGGTFLDNETAVYEIPLEKNADFLNDLAKIHFSDSIIISPAAFDPSFYYDMWTVRINYTDGSYELISCDHYGETYDQSGKITDVHHYGCDSEEWEALIQKYVPEIIFLHPHGTE